MTSPSPKTTPIDGRVRAAILAAPDDILDDQDLMRALIARNDQLQGENVVDLRGIAMNRLEARLDRLEDTHRSVLAAAYENVAGTNQVHRAVLKMLDATRFEHFLRDLDEDVARILRVDAVRVVLESAHKTDRDLEKRVGGVLKIMGPGFVETYLSTYHRNRGQQVSLGPVPRADARVYGAAANEIWSEAALRLNFGSDKLPGLLVMGSANPQQFTPRQGTDLLSFLAGVFERNMRRWLS